MSTSLQLYTQDGLTFTEIAERHGVRRQWVSECLTPLLTPKLRQQHEQARRDRQMAHVSVVRFRQLVRQGASRADMRRELGATKPQLDALMAGLSEATRRQWQSSRLDTSPRYSDAELEASLLEAARLLGRRQFGRSAYDELRRSHPQLISGILYAQRGGWSWWRKKVGLPVNDRHRNPAFGGAKYGAKNYRAAMKYVCAQLGNRLFSHPEYEANRRPTDPSGSAMRVRGGQRSTWLSCQEEFLPQFFRQKAA